MSETTKTVRVTKAMKWNAVVAVLDAMEQGQEYQPIHIPGTDKAAGVVLDIPTLRTFAKEELDLLARKNASKDGEKKLTPTQEENLVYQGYIMKFLAVQESGVTCTQVQKGMPELNDLSTNKVSSLLGSLVKAQKVEKATEKGKSLFTIHPDFIDEYTPADDDGEGEGE